MPAAKLTRKIAAAPMSNWSIAAPPPAGSASAAAGGATGNITIGIKFDQPGLGLKEGSGYTGFDVEVAKYVAKELGYSDSQVVFKESPSAQRETLIQTDQVKFIVGTYSITDARKEKVSFAGPYLVTGQSLLVKADNTDITGPDSLAGKKLCSVTGSTSATKIKDKVPGVNLQEFATYSECVAGLVSKAVDAVTTDDTILAGFAAQDQFKGKLKIVKINCDENQEYAQNYGVRAFPTLLFFKNGKVVDQLVGAVLPRYLDLGLLEWSGTHLRLTRAGLLVMAFVAIVAFYEAPVIGRVSVERRTALNGYVLKSELDASNARLFEVDRQRQAAQDALDEFETKAVQQDAADALYRNRLEQEIIDNEKLLAARDRSCLLDGDDAEFLRKP